VTGEGKKQYFLIIVVSGTRVTLPRYIILFPKETTLNRDLQPKENPSIKQRIIRDTNKATSKTNKQRAGHIAIHPSKFHYPSRPRREGGEKKEKKRKISPAGNISSVDNNVVSEINSFPGNKESVSPKLLEYLAGYKYRLQYT